MNFLDLLKKPGEKVTLWEMAEVRKSLPDRITASIPSCMYTQDGRFDYEVMIILFCEMAKRENPDITEEETGRLIGLDEPGHVDQIEKEILFFYTRKTRNEIETQFEEVKAAKDKAARLIASAIFCQNESCDFGRILPAWNFCPGCGQPTVGQDEVAAEVEKTVNPPEEPTLTATEMKT